MNTLKQAYRSQVSTSKCRGIDWQFTFESWLAWWGTDIALRGKGKGKLVMARRGDQGPYHPDNCIKLAHSQNVAEANSRRIVSESTRKKIGESARTRKIGTKGTPHTEETRSKISAALKGRVPWNKGITMISPVQEN